jgi:hypothetical protein
MNDLFLEDFLAHSLYLQYICRGIIVEMQFKWGYGCRVSLWFRVPGSRIPVSWSNRNKKLFSPL